jgi:peptidoglycan-associated lipoprotein
MATKTGSVILLAALLASAGCSKKRPAELPPAPPTTTTATDPYGQTGSGTDTTGVPGSREDFLRQAGSDRVLFGTDSHEIDAEARAVLDAQARWLTQYPSKTITIEGHCDERGTREYNLALGDRRANAAKNYLASRGIGASRMSVISYGKERPASMGSDESAWAQNRRAVTVLVN